MSKTIELRPLVGDDDLLVDPSASGRPGAVVGEKNKIKSLNFPSSEKKKPRRRLAHKPKESSSSRAPDSDLIFWLRDEPKEGDIFIAYGTTSPEERAAAKGETMKADPPQVRKVDVEMRDETSRDAGSSPWCHRCSKVTFIHRVHV